MNIVPYDNSYRDEVIALSIDAWTPVFRQTQNEVPSFVYNNFYPTGWDQRQAADVGALLDSNPDDIWIYLENEHVIGYVGIAIHPKDNMGEITIIAVLPSYQGRGIGASLLEFGESKIKSCGMKMVMVETVGDSGHKPARQAYESQGYIRWPVARYFKELQ